jgi:hypothetical protein
MLDIHSGKDNMLISLSYWVMEHSELAQILPKTKMSLFSQLEPKDSGQMDHPLIGHKLLHLSLNLEIHQMLHSHNKFHMNNSLLRLMNMHTDSGSDTLLITLLECGTERTKVGTSLLD